MTTRDQPPTLRDATEADAEALAILARRTFVDAFGEHTAADDLARFLHASYGTAQQSAELRSPSLHYLVAESGGEFVGFALLRQGARPACIADPEAIEIQRFYVDAPWHGSGLAQRLMTACVERAHRLGATSLWLGAWERNVKALRFYAAQGFSPVGSQVFQIGSDPQTDTVLQRALAPNDATA